MFALKKTLVNLRVSYALKKTNIGRETVGYENARNMGILFVAGDIAKHELVKKLMRMLKADGKNVEVLSFLPKDQENHDFFFDFFREEDVSVWGQFKAENVKNFIEKKFDYLFHIDEVTILHIDHVLAKCRAKCRVGHYMEGKSGFYEMMIKTEMNNTDEIINQLYHYTKSLI